LPFDLREVDSFFHHLVQRRKLSQLLHCVDDAIRYIVNLSFRVESSDTEADGAVRHVIAQTQGLQYIRWLECGRGARRTTGNCNVPERIPRSCPPPSRIAESCTRGFFRRTYKAPTPFGPYSLCPVNDMMEMFDLFTSIGTLPIACTASEWKRMPFSLQIAPI